MEHLERPRITGRLFAAVLLLLVAACFTYKSVPLEQAPHELEPGNRVRLTTTEGSVLEFQVVSVTAEEVAGEIDTLRFEELASVERRRFDLLRSFGVYLLIGVVGLALSGGDLYDFDFGW